MGLDKTLCHSTLQSTQTLGHIQWVINVNLASYCDGIVASMLVAPVLRTFVQYLIAFDTRPETGSDVQSGSFVFGESKISCCLTFNLGNVVEFDTEEMF